MEVQIRKAGIEELDEIARVEAECFPAAEAAGRDAFRERLETFPDSFFVAESEGKIIGFINGCVTDERTIRDEMFQDSGLHRPDGAYQSVFGLDVTAPNRRQGIAAQLMNRLIKDAREKGRRGLILTCKERLVHYYEQFGFQNLGVSASVHGGAVWYDMILEF